MKDTKYNTTLSNSGAHTALSSLQTKNQIFPALFSNSWFENLFNFDPLNFHRALDVSAHYPYNVFYAKDNAGNVTKVVIEIALAGIDKENISVNVSEGKLIVNILSSVEKEDTKESSERIYLRRGISRRASRFEFHLIEAVDVKGITSSHQKGLLVIEIPIKQPETFNIDIKTE